MAKDPASIAKGRRRAEQGHEHTAERGADQHGEPGAAGGEGVPGLEIVIGQERGHDGKRSRQEHPCPGAEHGGYRHQQRSVRRPRRRHGGQRGDGQRADTVGGHHHRPGTPPVGGIAADGDQGGSRHAVGGHHCSQQQRPAVTGEHVPRQGHGVAGVAQIRRQLPGGEQPEPPVAQRRESAWRSHRLSPPLPGRSGS